MSMGYRSKSHDAKAYVCPCCRRPLPISHFYLRTNDRGYRFRDLKHCLRCKGLRLLYPRKRSNVVAQKARRRYNKVNLPHDLTSEQWDAILDVFGHQCAYCDRRIDITQDHVVPISSGGAYTLGNIVPACGLCNSSKGAMDMRTWLRDEQRYEAIMMSIGDACYETQ